MAWKRYADCTAEELQRLVKEGPVIAVLPIGATEQHGPHLPVGTDFYAAEAVAETAVKKTKQDTLFLLLPVISYALSIEHSNIPGTVSLSYETVVQMLVEIGRSLKRLGVHKMVIINGHGGNNNVIAIAGRLLRRENFFVYMVNDGAIRTKLGAKDTDMHADVFETSVMMALRPDTVKKEKIHKTLDEGTAVWAKNPEMQTDLISFWFIEDVTNCGVVGEPTRATEVFGQQYLEKQTDLVASALDVLAAFKPVP